MNSAWVVRPNPHHTNRVNEFLNDNLVAIGWPGIGNLSDATTRNKIKNRLKTNYNYESKRSLGQKAGSIDRFLNEMDDGDMVVIPDGPTIYIGEIKSIYKYVKELDNEEEGYPHQREVKWFHNKKGIKRNLLKGKTYDSLKGQLTVFNAPYDEINKLVNNKGFLFTENPNQDLKKEYLKRLQTGLLRNLNASTFENAVKELFSNYYSGLNRLSTNNSEEGDTDLLAELPGDVTIRIQVKHFYVNKGELKPWVVKQLADSMDEGDNGIIVTSGTISEEAKRKANETDNKYIGFIDGKEFVELLFESVEDMPNETLAIFGLKQELAFL